VYKVFSCYLEEDASIDYLEENYISFCALNLRRDLNIKLVKYKLLQGCTVV
jgi:hypothetical protein